jgi:cytochrome c2
MRPIGLLGLLILLLAVLLSVLLSPGAYGKEPSIDTGSKLLDKSAVDPKPAQPSDDPSAKLFNQKCSGCHTVGKGTLVGPDLAEVNGWNTQELTTSVKRMEKMVGPLTDEEVKGLVDFLKDSKVNDRLKQQEEKVLAPSLSKDSGSAKLGAELFMGQKDFTNGGMACNACHQVNGQGGTMGPDLTLISDKMGDNALLSACEQASFKVMKAVYRNHQITREESLHLVKFFNEAKHSKEKAGEQPVSWFAAIASFIAIALVSFGYRKRNTSVRAKLKKR